MSIVAQSPSHPGKIARLFVRDAATLLLCSARSCYALYDPSTTTLIRRYDQRTSEATVLFSHSQPWRFCQLQAWFKCTHEVGVTPLYSRSNFVEDLIKDERF